MLLTNKFCSSIKERWWSVRVFIGAIPKPGQTRGFGRFFFQKKSSELFFPRRKCGPNKCQKITQMGQNDRNNRVHRNNPPGYFFDFFPRRFFRLGKNNPAGYFFFGPCEKTGFGIAPFVRSTSVRMKTEVDHVLPFIF